MHVLEAALFTQLVEQSLKVRHACLHPQQPAAERASIATHSVVLHGLSRILSSLSAVIGQAARSLAGGKEEKAAHVLHCAGDGL